MSSFQLHNLTISSTRTFACVLTPHLVALCSVALDMRRLTHATRLRVIQRTRTGRDSYNLAQCGRRNGIDKLPQPKSAEDLHKFITSRTSLVSTLASHSVAQNLVGATQGGIINNSSDDGTRSRRASADYNLALYPSAIGMRRE